MGDKCEECKCRDCDNNTCFWVQCGRQKSDEDCFTQDCTHYYNMQAEIDEGFLDGYEEDD